MTRTALVLGQSGRFGRNASHAFQAAGWQVRGFDRARDSLDAAAEGVDVIVNAWNPPYAEWAKVLPRIHAQVRAVAKRVDATVVIPGNVYVFGAQTPPPWGPNAPHQAANPMGRLRIEMERAYHDEGVRTIILRGGDFLDTEASGNWFDQIMIKSLSKGRFVYPGDPTIPHAWAYLPDIAKATVMLAEKDDLPRFSDFAFPGYTLSGNDLVERLSKLIGRDLTLKTMNWLPLKLAGPFWPMGRRLAEMRYLWNTPHWLEDASFRAALPDFAETSVEDALAAAIGQSRV